MTYRVRLPDEAYYREQVACQNACPVGTDARGYVRATAAGDFEKAYLIARGPNPLASICGRVCGAPCEAACRRGKLDAPVSIRALKRFCTERYGTESARFEPLEILGRLLDEEKAGHDCEGQEELRTLARQIERVRRLGADDGAKNATSAKTVAIVGAGPAGLACAHDLALFGANVVVYESEREPAGMLLYGIPEYRLPRDLIRGEVEVIRALGVRFVCNTRVGVDIGFDEILRENDAVVIAVGAKNSRRIPLPGLDGPGVLGGVEFLRDVALGDPSAGLGKNVVVVGGGNVAYDVARTVVRQIGIDVSRTALRQPDVAGVTLASLESLDEMPADDVEILEGEEEGVRRLNSVGPVSVERGSDGRVEGIVFKKCTRVFDDDGRFAPRFDDAALTRVPCDTVILSIGQSIDLSFIEPSRDGVALSDRGFVECDPETLVTSRENVWVAGDVAYGPRLLIDAVASGKQIARRVAAALGVAEAPSETRAPAAGRHVELPRYTREAGYETIARHEVPVLSASERLVAQDRIVELGFTEEQVRLEASRCFDCGVNPIFDGERCILCGGCVDVCPESCLKIVSGDRLETNEDLCMLRARVVPGLGADDVSAILKDEEVCIRCGVCAERCPNGAITMERFCFGFGASR